jgi:AcrR family transcriptional regulator
MGRRARIGEAALFAAVAESFIRNGQVTVASLRAASGLSTGSLYHRFPSREALVAAAWVEASARFVAACERALAVPGSRGLLEMALATPRFARAHPALAAMLFCCREAEVMGEGAPDDRREAARALTARLDACIAEAARRAGRPRLPCRLALLAAPEGAVRLYLPLRPPPVSLNSQIRRMATTMLDLPQG